jgi:hypothetical protein
MTGTYTEIIEIWTAKENYSPGETVWVTVPIKNLYSQPIHIYCVAMVDGTRFIELDTWVSAGLTYSFGGYFVMPDKSVTITAYSYYEAVDGLIYFDDEKSKTVSLTELVPAFSEFAIADYRKV